MNVPSEIAINDEKAFTSIVNIAKDALAGKVAKKETVKAEVKKEAKAETKKAVKAEAKDYSKMTVAELKEEAKNKGIEGYTTMKKAELVAALS